MTRIGSSRRRCTALKGRGFTLPFSNGWASAFAAATALADPLLEGRVEPRHLRAVQRRREPPIRVIQGLQSLAHRRIVAPAVGGGGIPSLPPPVRALLGLRIVRDLPARIIAFGIWPVHVRS